jgi:hypothetical protein
MKQAINNSPAAPGTLMNTALQIENDLDEIYLKFNRESKFPSTEENPPSLNTINERLSVLRWTHWRSTEPITKKEQRAYDILLNEFPPIYERIKIIYNMDIKNLEDKLEKFGAPWTPGRLPELKLR